MVDKCPHSTQYQSPPESWERRCWGVVTVGLWWGYWGIFTLRWYPQYKFLS
jgi:hypothetical protein